MTIVLIGYMASGKSTIGKKLARKLEYEFIDLDDFIEVQENAVVSEIFKTKGELYFRKQETKYLKELLKSKNNRILSVGGGTPCYSDNMDVILNAKHAKSIYLERSVKALADKLIKKKSKRPLIAHIETKEALTEFIAKHLFERRPFYSKAEIKIAIDDKSKDEVVEEILEILV